MLLTCAAIPNVAWAAECPDFHINVQRGSTFTVDASACDLGGFGIGPPTTTPTHGTLNTSQLFNDQLSYTNDGGTNTTDFFSFTDENGSPVNVYVTVVVIKLTPTSLSAGTLNSAYTPTTLSASGGTPSYSFSLVSGALPAGMSLSPAGVISGTPSAAGTFNITVRATDSGANNASSNGPFFGDQAYSLSVSGPPLSITPSSVPAGQVGQSYSTTISASGGTAPYSYSISAGTLPAGLALNTATGVVSGTPTAGGTFNLSVTAHDSLSSTGTLAYTLSIAAPTISLTPASLPAATQGGAYSQALGASGGTASYTFALTTGSLPAGMSLSSAGILSGTPTAFGSFNIQISATDHSSGTGPYTGSSNYTLTVNPSVPSIATGNLSAGTVGTSYSQTITGSGGNAPYTFAISSGSLPSGLTLSSTGVLAGTPTQGGSFPLTVTLTDAASSTATHAYTLTMNPATVTLSPTTLPAAILHAAYSQALAGQGGTAPYTFALTSGSLPPGMTLSGTGALGGTATAAGTFNFSVTATDASSGSGPYSGTQAYSVVVSAPTITLSPVGLAAAQVGTATSQTISASGGAGPYTYAVTAGSLPAGLSLSSAGVLTGTPSAGGSFNFSVTATDANTNSGTRAYSLTVNAPSLTLNPATLPNGSDGVAYSQSLGAGGGTPPYTYTVTSGTLPAGISLASNGTLSGTPSAVGTANFSVTVQDSSSGSGPYTTSHSYSLTIAAPTLGLTPATPTLSGSYAQSFSQTFAASGGSAPYTFTESGSLPNGVSWNAATATLAGTPTQAGNFPITISATDHSSGTGAPFTVTSGYTLSVAAPTITIAPANVAGAGIGVSYSAQLNASGGVAPYTYTVSAGALPSGIGLSSAGALTGTPTSGGTFNFTVNATDAHGISGTQAYTLTVAAATLSLNPASLPAATAESAYSQNVIANGGTAPYTYAVSAGMLPGGLSLNAVTGALSGTPTAAGTFNFSLRVTDSSSGTGAPYSATQSYSLVVNAPTIGISPASLPTLQIAVPLSQQLTASGGNGSYTFTVGSGSLPPGLTLSSSGLLAGTPSTAGSFNFVVSVHDGQGFSGSQAYSATINAPSLTLGPGNLPAATAETPYSQTLVGAGGTAPYSYAVSAGALPAGLSLNASTGVLSGTPTAAGNFTFSLRVSDSSSGSGAPFSTTHSYSFVVTAPAIGITPATLPNVQVAMPLSQQLAAHGGNGSYSYALDSGNLPSGISLSPGGLLAGTPIAAGSFSFVVMAKDGLGFSGTQAYTLTVGAPTLSLSPGSLPAATAELAYTQTFSGSGGTAPYSYAVAAGALPAGLSLNASTGALSGTPTAAGSFNFSVRVTDSSNGAGAPFSATHAYTLAVGAPAISVSPAALPGAQDGAAFSQQLGASGGHGSYSYDVSAGNLPPGLSLSSSGLLAGTPSSPGSYSFTITAKDALAFSGSQAYALVVGQPRPIAVNDTAATSANSPVTIAVTSNDTGPISSLAIVQAASHGSSAVSGLNVVYTPNSNYFGSDSFSYAASGPGGTSATATVTITVTALAVPTAIAQSATTLAGKPVTIHAASGATGGPFSGVNVPTPPSAGSLSTSGTDIVFTPAANASGAVAFDYTLSNAFGTSLPAKVTVAVNPLPVPAAVLNISVIAGVPAVVDLTRGASGGPFTGAALVSVTPANAGSATISGSSGDYLLHYVPNPTSSGAVTINFTLSNAYATSAPGVVNIAVTPRSDPSKDQEVVGVLEAQADATRRFATAQIDNFQQRLESLHQEGNGGGFSNGLSFSSASMQRLGAYPLPASLDGSESISDPTRRYLTQPGAITHGNEAPTTANGKASGSDTSLAGLALWSGGAVNFGSSDANASVRGLDFTTAGVSFGGDYRISPSFAFGAGLGYGHDDTDVGNHGSRSTADSYTAAFYASYHPGAAVYIDGLIGYQWLSFDSLRYVTDDGNRVNGQRNGDQLFASFSTGYDYRRDKLLVSPYARLDVASASLGGYTENGDAVYALNYRSQTVKTTTTSLGVHMDYQTDTDYGSFAPRLRLEYQHDFQGAGQATMSYADLLDGPLYRATLNQWGQDRGLIGIGASLQTPGAWTLRAEYEYLFGSGTQQTQSILLNISKKF